MFITLRQLTRSLLLFVATPSASASAWVGAPATGDASPPTLCVTRSGPSAFYVQEQVELQQRHGSWTLYWRATRPTGFGSEEQVALLTEAESATVLNKLAQRLSTPSRPSRPRLSSAQPGCPAPSPAQQPRWGVHTTLSLFLAPDAHPPEGLLADLSRAERATQAERGLWLQWSLGDVEASLDPRGEVIYSLVEALLSAHLERPPLTDQLLTEQERGQLLVKLSRPARLEVDGVSYGVPSQRPLLISPGLHTLTLYPLSPPFGPFTYRQVEVERGKLTRLTPPLQ